MDAPSSYPGNPQPQVIPQVVQTRPAPARSIFRWIFGLMLFLGLGFMGIVFLSFIAMMSTFSSEADSHVEEKYHSLEKHGEDKVAIITVEGAILDGEGYVKHQIDHIRDDESVKAIVLRVDSPGGTVTGSDYIYHHLNKLTKERELPLVVSMGGMAASGGYYVSMAVGDRPDSIYAEPTTWTGSIGVVIPHYDVAGLMDRFEIKEDSIKSHRLKQMGSPFKHMTDEEKQIFQTLVDESFNGFKDIVKSGRPKLDDATLTKVATGQIFTTDQAISFGLVDKKGFIEDAIDRAIALAKLDKSNTKAVRYKRPVDLFGSLLSMKAQSTQPSLKNLLEMSTPRAWYIFTWPGIGE
jgi:protease-4